MRIARVSTLLFVAMVFFGANALRAEDVPQEYRDCVRKGLEWLIAGQDSNGDLRRGGQLYVQAMAAAALGLLGLRRRRA